MTLLKVAVYIFIFVLGLLQSSWAINTQEIYLNENIKIVATNSAVSLDVDGSDQKVLVLAQPQYIEGNKLKSTQNQMDFKYEALEKSNRFFLSSDMGKAALVIVEKNSARMLRFDIPNFFNHEHYNFTIAKHISGVSIIQLYKGTGDVYFTALIPKSGPLKNKVFFTSQVVDLIGLLHQNPTFGIIINQKAIKIINNSSKFQMSIPVRENKYVEEKFIKGSDESTLQNNVTNKPQLKQNSTPDEKNAQLKNTKKSRNKIKPLKFNEIRTTSATLLANPKIKSTRVYTDTRTSVPLNRFINDNFRVIHVTRDFPFEHEMNRKLFESAVVGLNMAQGGSVRIIGKPGVGKSHFMNALVAFMMKNNLVTDRVLIRLDATDLEAGNGGVIGPLETKIKALKMLSEIVPVTLIVDEMHTLKGRGTHSQSNIDFLEMILSELATGQIKIIGTTHDWESHFSENSALGRRFSVKIQIPEPSESQILKIMKEFKKEHFNELPDLDEEILKQVISLSSRFDPLDAQPAKTLRLWDRLLSTAKTFGRSIGTDELVLVASELYGYDISELEPDKIAFKIKNLQEKLDQKLIGLENEKITSVKALANYFLFNKEKSSRPLSLLFYGDKGSGKTTMGQSIAEFIGYRFERVMMSDFSGHNDVKSFQRKIGMILKTSPFAIILLDELEKASKEVQNALLQILDQGYLETDLTKSDNSKGTFTPVNAAHAIFIGGTNAGKDNANNPSGNPIERNMEQDGLSLTVFDRFQYHIPFRSPDDNMVKEIINLKLSDKILEFNKIGYKLTVDKIKLIEYIRSKTQSQSVPSIGFTDTQINNEPLSVRNIDRILSSIQSDISFKIINSDNAEIFESNIDGIIFKVEKVRETYQRKTNPVCENMFI